MKIDILTLFPEMFEPLYESILGRAQENNILNINTVNIRDFTLDRHNKTDETPFGGGAGMVMMAQPVFDSLRHVEAGRKKIIYMSPKGRMLDEPVIRRVAAYEELVILCGHYEDIDQRILDAWDIEEISVGDYILTGGELPAMILIDAVARMIPDVLGNEHSNDEESIYSGLLEYPQYTRPREFEGMSVPEVLLSGNHRAIHLWQLEQSMALTKDRRPDLWRKFVDSPHDFAKDERKVMEKVLREENSEDE